MTTPKPSSLPPDGRPAFERLAGARSVAVIGASDRTDVHGAVLRNLAASPGVTVVPVNPRRTTVAGLPCVASVHDAPAPVDAAIVLVGDERAEAAVRDALDAGVRAVIVPGLALCDGGAEAGERIGALAREHGAVLVGPDCMGYAAPGELQAWAGTIPASVRPGGLGIAAHSGAIGEALIALGSRLGLRAVLSLGNEVGCDAADACGFFARDERTTAVGLFLETVRRPEALEAALEELRAAGKPVVCLRVGRSQAARDASWAHSAAAPEAAALLDGIVARTGAIEVADYPDFAETLAVLDAAAWPAGTRIGAVTNSGGEAALLADMAAAAGAPFPPVPAPLAGRLATVTPRGMPPVNPVDAWWPDDPHGAFREVLEHLAASGEFDMLAAHIDTTPFLESFERRHAERLADTLVDVAGAHGLVPVILSAQPSEPIEHIARLASERRAVVVRAGAVGLRAVLAVGRWVAAHAGASTAVAQS